MLNIRINIKPKNIPKFCPRKPITYEVAPEKREVTEEAKLSAIPLFDLYFSTIIACMVGYVVA